MSGYYHAVALLEVALAIVQELRQANDDSRYGLLKSAHDHIMAALGDLDADMK